MVKPRTFSVHYRFGFADGTVRQWRLELETESLNLSSELPAAPPEWVRLSHHQCRNCPLNERQSPYCPVAHGLVEVIDHFKDCFSYEEVKVVIHTREREYRKTVALHEGLRSLLGLHMPTGGCPILGRLKPLVSVHLPFTTPKEAVFRFLSMYLLAQYFRSQKGATADWEMKMLGKVFDDIRVLNRSFCRRLSSTGIKDASLNAVVGLDSLADFASQMLAKRRLRETENLFHAYF